jgi:excisionase family DNA binding protein
MSLDLRGIRILTIKEVADLLRVDRSTISRYAISGALKSHKIGNRRLFKEEDVWEFFENRIALEYVSERRKHGNSLNSET